MVKYHPMATIENYSVETEAGIKSEIIRLTFGGSVVNVYTHGAINTIHQNGADVTAQRDPEEQLVHFTEMFRQRGGNPVMGPMAGRYDNSKIAQPGHTDIHGVFAGMTWNISEVNDVENYIVMKLPAEVWINELKNYYSFAALSLEEGSERRRALARLIAACKERYSMNKAFVERLNSMDILTSSLGRENQIGLIEREINFLINIAYPGEADITRRITIEDVNGIPSFLDEVQIQNVSDGIDYLDASGFHTYFNALLTEIVMPKGFWGKNDIAPEHYDDNLPDVRIREIDQTNTELNRRIFIVPEAELQVPTSNQIIYKDENTVGIREVAIENWRQPGDSDHYPKISRVIPARGTSLIAVRIIVLEGSEIPYSVKDYLDKVNTNLGIIEA